jgi:hypothetical protein
MEIKLVKRWKKLVSLEKAEIIVTGRGENKQILQ